MFYKRNAYEHTEAGIWRKYAYFKHNAQPQIKCIILGVLQGNLYIAAPVNIGHLITGWHTSGV